MKTTDLAKEQKQRREAVRAAASKHQAVDAEAAFRERLIEIRDTQSAWAYLTDQEAKDFDGEQLKNKLQT